MEYNSDVDIQALEEELRRFFLPLNGGMDKNAPIFQDLKKSILYFTAGIFLRGKKYEPERQSSSFKGGYGNLRRIREYLDPDDYQTLQDIMREYTGKTEENRLGGKIHLRYDGQMEAVMDIWFKEKIMEYMTYEFHFGAKDFSSFFSGDFSYISSNDAEDDSADDDADRMSLMIFDKLKNRLIKDVKTFFKIELESMNLNQLLNDLDEFTLKRLSVHKKKFMKK